MIPSLNIFGFGKPKSYLGVDIGTLSIKIVELSNEDGRPKLQNYGILHNYALAAASSLQDAATWKTQKVFGGEAVLMLKKLLKEGEFLAKHVNVSVPIFSSFLTIMEFPQMSEAEVAKAVQFEAKKYIPISLDNVVMDWSLIGVDNNNKLQVLLIAIPKDLVNEYTIIAKDVNLKLLNIELETVAAGRALIGNDSLPTALIDVGSRDTTISIVDNGFLRISHSIETSGEDLTRALAAGLNIDWQRAEEIKKQNGLKILDSNSQIAAVLTPLLDVISAAARNIIDLYFSKTKRKVEKVVIYGGSAKMPGLAEYLDKKLALIVSIGNPFSRIIYSDKLKPVIDEMGHEFTIAVGLALKGLQS